MNSNTRTRPVLATEQVKLKGILRGCGVGFDRRSVILIPINLKNIPGYFVFNSWEYIQKPSYFPSVFNQRLVYIPDIYSFMTIYSGNKIDQVKLKFISRIPGRYPGGGMTI